MISIYEIGRAVRARRQALGLTQARLSQLADLSRQTIQRLETGAIKDLSFNRVTNLLNVLGLSLDAPTTAARLRKKGLRMAAKTSSVSYRREMTAEELQQALCSGDVPKRVKANLLHFLDETPIPIVVMAVEEAAQQVSVNPAGIWSNIGKLAQQLGATRPQLWI